jgi:RimJ/RimL family protein N-acetyltransferase
MVFSPLLTTFRALATSDFPLLQRWLNTPHVREWYREYGQNQPSLQDIFRKYQPRIAGMDPVHCYLVLYSSLPVAYIQWYRVTDYPSSQEMVKEIKNTAGLDTYIGEMDYVHRGFGSVYMKKFLREVVFTKPDIISCIIDPEPENKIAIRAYEKTGFHYLHNAWNPQDRVQAYIMIIERNALKSDPNML